MRWLQWATADLEKGIGGVEVHCRSVARELGKLGIDAKLSNDPKDLPASLEDSEWDVIHTHGSFVPLGANPARGRRGGKRAIHIHTLHGTTLGRMAACREWTWVGGYHAAARELASLRSADIVLSVHPRLSLYALAERLGKTRAVCSNGWDSQDEITRGGDCTLPRELSERLRGQAPFWLYVGRGSDPVKNVDGLTRAFNLVPDLRWVAVPGEGFEKAPGTLKTGVLSTAQVARLFEVCNGLVLPSRYEGQSLTILEALAYGVPVVATRVGGIPTLPEGIEGLVTVDSTSPQSIADALRGAARYSNDADARTRRAEINQKLLPTWADVAKIAVSAVEEFR